MILTASHIYRLAHELRESIRGGWIKEVLTARSERAVILKLRSRGSTRYLLLSSDPEFCRVELLQSPEKNWATRPQLFAPIPGGALTDVAQIGFDRVLEFAIEKEAQIGAPRRYRLILEMTGPQANLILVECETAKVIQCLRPQRPGKRSRREIAPGKQYSPLPAVGKLWPTQLDLEVLSSLIEKQPRKTFKPLLLSECWGVNDSMVQEIAARSGVRPQARVGELSEEDLKAVCQATAQLYRLPPSAKEKPTVVLDPAGNPKELLFYLPCDVPKKSRRSFPSLLEATSFFYREFLRKRELQAEWSRIARQVNDLLTKRRKGQTQLRRKLQEFQRKDLYKTCGDLLMLRPDKKERGQKETTVNNIFKTPPQRVTIELDPKMSILENAKRYYRRFQKAVSGERAVQAQLRKTSSDLAILEGVQGRLQTDPSEDLLINLKKDLAPLGIAVTPATVAKDRKATRKQRQFRPREFVTSDGWRVLVGRSDRENDYLTFKLASKEDLWFHARGAHGSHVILKGPSKTSDPSKVSIEQAASVAAYFSKQRTSRKVSVSYTQVKYLRKPKRAKPGLVVVQREKSIMVEPKLLRPLGQNPHNRR